MSASAVDHIAILAESDYQDQELWVPYYRLLEAGYRSVVVAPRKGIYRSKTGYPVEATMTPADADPAVFAGVVIPGGWAPDRMRMDDGLLKLVQALFEADRVVAAICHAGWVLASAGVCRGRRVTCYESIRDDLVNAGAEYVDAEVVVDGNLITSRKPSDLPAFCGAIVKALADRS